jgi:hypothetical protein
MSGVAFASAKAAINELVEALSVCHPPRMPDQERASECRSVVLARFAACYSGVSRAASPRMRRSIRVSSEEQPRASLVRWLAMSSTALPRKPSSRRLERSARHSHRREGAAPMLQHPYAQFPHQRLIGCDAPRSAQLPTPPGRGSVPAVARVALNTTRAHPPCPLRGRLLPRVFYARSRSRTCHGSPRGVEPDRVGWPSRLLEVCRPAPLRRAASPPLEDGGTSEPVSHIGERFAFGAEARPPRVITAWPAPHPLTA